MKCPSCGNDTPSSSEFCGVCGERFENKTPPEAEVKCPSCGKETPGGSQFCGVCGAALRLPKGDGKPWYKNLAIQIVLVIVVIGLGVPFLISLIAGWVEEIDRDFDQAASTLGLTSEPARVVPENQEPDYSHLCRSQFHSGDLDTAIESCARFFDTEFFDLDHAAPAARAEIAEIHAYRGHAYSGLGRHEEAIEDYKQVIELDRRDTGDRGTYELVASEYVKWAAQLHNTDPDLSLDKLEQAITYREEWIGLNPPVGRNPPKFVYHVELGRTYKVLGERNSDLRLMEKALEHFDNALELEPGDEYAAGEIEAILVAMEVLIPTPLPTATSVPVSPAGDSQSAVLTEIYTHEVSGFSVKYPAGWQVSEQAQPDAPEWVLPDVLLLGLPGAFVRIEIQRVPENFSPEKLVSDWIGGARNFKEDSRVKIESLPGYLSTGKGLSVGNQVYILAVVNHPWGIAAVFTSEPAMEEVTQPIFESMIESFRVLAPTR